MRKFKSVKNVVQSMHDEEHQQERDIKQAIVLQLLKVIQNCSVR